MKLSLSLLILFPLAASGAESQPECKPWTKLHLFDTNPNLQPAEDAYVAMVAGTLEANCLDDSGPKECKLGLGQSDVGDAYTMECTKMGGKMWTYTLSPLCGDITSTDQTELKGVLQCASASCVSIGAANLIPQQGFYTPFTEAGYTCATGTNDLAQVETAALQSQPECYNFTQIHLYDTNPALQPAESAYFLEVATVMETNCLTGDEFTGCGDVSMGESTTGDAYIAECHKNGGHVWSYTVSPLCGTFGGSDAAGTVSGVLACASASCESVGAQNLIPPTEVIYIPFSDRGYSCATSTNDLKKVSVPSTTVDDDSAGQPPSSAIRNFLSWMPLVGMLAGVMVW